jgi:hypothetical protein
LQLCDILRKESGYWGREEWKRGVANRIGGIQSIFEVINLCHDDRYMVLCIYQNLWSYRTEKVNPNVYYRLQLTITYQDWLIKDNKCTILIQDVNDRRKYVRVEGKGRQW